MIGNGIFGRGHHSRLDQLRPPFQLAEHTPRRRFIAAAGRNFADVPAPVPKLRQKRQRLRDDPLRTISPGRHLGCARLALRWLPTGELLPGPCADFRANRQRSRF